MKRMEGVTMGKLAIGAVAVALVLAGVAFAAGIDGSGDDRGLRTSSSTTTTTNGTTTTEDRADDRNRRGHRGKKAEQKRRGRANQARNRIRNRAREAGEDVRGPCDEAEHANDPRCTGAESDDGRGRSGRGRSGGNSGPG
jgi:hypothetical protein